MFWIRVEVVGGWAVEFFGPCEMGTSRLGEFHLGPKKQKLKLFRGDVLVMCKQAD